MQSVPNTGFYQRFVGCGLLDVHGTSLARYTRVELPPAFVSVWKTGLVVSVLVNKGRQLLLPGKAETRSSAKRFPISPETLSRGLELVH